MAKRLRVSNITRSNLFRKVKYSPLGFRGRNVLLFLPQLTISMLILHFILIPPPSTKLCFKSTRATDSNSINTFQLSLYIIVILEDIRVLFLASNELLRKRPRGVSLIYKSKSTLPLSVQYSAPATCKPSPFISLRILATLCFTLSMLALTASVSSPTARLISSVINLTNPPFCFKHAPTAPHCVCPSTTASLQPRCSVAYSILPSWWLSITLPATRITNSSPIPAEKYIRE